MKYIIYFGICFFCLLSLKSFSQNNYQEVKQMKKFLYDLKLDSSFKKYYNLKVDSFYLPKYFRSNKWLYESLVNYNVFDTTSSINSSLSKVEIIALKNVLIKDTFNLRIKRNWFSTKRIRLFSNNEIQNGFDIYLGITKPLFFRNHTLCLFTVYYKNGMSSNLFILENGHWKFFHYFFGFQS